MTDASAQPKFVLWPYTPSLPGGMVAAIVFFILSGIHIFRLVKNRTWFCIPFVIGALFEAVGYAGRAAAHNDTENKNPYIVQSTLILLAPILFAASIYMILGRLIQRTESAAFSIVRTTWTTKIFVGGDILCFCIQGGGAGMLIQAKDDAGFKMGENIILGGLILQILIFGFFVVVSGVWHRRLAARPTSASAEVPWGKYICGFITIRNLCRVIEYALGRNGYLLSHEWPLYVYDFLPMMLTLIVCIAWYDPNIKPGRKPDIEFAMRR
ncbi:RTA1 like protein [Cucurbitaria berberidis CBS 394.84]|uniref:RTA1 like protein n=1 Tax=Cucurbitaria berberidis CBS 394.84 TaxID=1168544 RepID=A0A9P4L7G9_9PLEO|nr:RTA1 like protein [Cucurbitaria berberidis CBS 394.84]KAF1844312.1 RTA1 like protein [Cucurbitaria berberidis CBS 394.84]